MTKKPFPHKPRDTALAAAITSRKGGIHWTAENQHTEMKKPTAEARSSYRLYVGNSDKARLEDFVEEFDTADEAMTAGQDMVRDGFGTKYIVLMGD